MSESAAPECGDGASSRSVDLVGLGGHLFEVVFVWLRTVTLDVLEQLFAVDEHQSVYAVGSDDSGRNPGSHSAIRDLEDLSRLLYPDHKPGRSSQGTMFPHNKLTRRLPIRSTAIHHIQPSGRNF